VEARTRGRKLVTSAEVLQELLHAYRSVGRLETLDAALELAVRGVDQLLPVEAEDVIHARGLADQYAGLTARDLLRLSMCQLRKIRELKTFDRKLLAAFRRRARKR
jgi:predicted nucleic acid-binding protein